jgi:hypothetical protein
MATPGFVALVSAAAMLAAGHARADLGLQAKAGTLGIGLEVSSGFGDRFSLNLGVNSIRYRDKDRSGNVDYDQQYDLQSAALLVHYHPDAGFFRLVLGVLYNENELTLNGIPGPGSTYNINGVTYTAAQVGNLTGTLKFRRAAPYLGIGWGNRPHGYYGISVDLGFLYQGSPRLSLEASGASSDPALAADLELERAQAESDLRGLKWFPVASVGLYRRF